MEKQENIVDKLQNGGVLTDTLEDILRAFQEIKRSGGKLHEISGLWDAKVHIRVKNARLHTTGNSYAFKYSQGTDFASVDYTDRLSDTEFSIAASLLCKLDGMAEYEILD